MRSGLGALLALIVVFGALGVVAVFVRWERTGRSHIPTAIVLGALTFESIVLPSPGTTPNGLFRVRAAGEDIRTVAVLALLAVIARAWVRGLPTRVTITGLLWGANVVWYGAAAVIGNVRGHDSNLVIFELQSLIYIAIGYLLFAGTPVRAFMAERAVAWWTAVLTAAVGVFAMLTLFKVFTDVSLGIQRFPGLGNYGAAGRSVVTAIAIIVIVTESCRARPRAWVVVCSVLLLLSPVVGIQRASLVQAAVCLVGLGVVVFGRTWRSRARLTPTVSGLVVLGLIGLVVFAVVLPPALTGKPSILVASLDRAFTGEGQLESVDARERLWSESRNLIEEHPLVGWGLGKRAELARPFPKEPLEVSSHNILLDLWIRVGAVGVALFLLAIASSLFDAARAWRSHPDPVVAAFAMGCAIGLIGVVAKGFVEPLFDNFRLAMLLGMLLGGIASAAHATDDEERRRDSLRRDDLVVARID